MQGCDTEQPACHIRAPLEDGVTYTELRAPPEDGLSYTETNIGGHST